MISNTHHLNPQQATDISVTKEPPVATASVDVKFGDTFRTIYPQNADE